MSETSLPFDERPAGFRSDGIRLAGIICEPTAERKQDRAALILPGWSRNRSGPHNLLTELARELAAAGLPSLRFDFRGRGDSAGDPASTDLDGMIADALAAAGFLRNELGVEKIATVGLCSGGNVALGAATLDEKIDCVLALSTLPFQSSKPSSSRAARLLSRLGALTGKLFRAETYRKIFRGEVDYRRILRNLFGGEGRGGIEGKGGPAPEQGPLAVEGQGASAWGREADGTLRNLKDSRCDVMADFAAYRGRVVFVYGGADAEGRAAQKHYAKFTEAHAIPAEFVEIPGANHNFYSREWKRQLTGEIVGRLGI